MARTKQPRECGRDGAETLPSVVSIECEESRLALKKTAVRARCPLAKHTPKTKTSGSTQNVLAVDLTLGWQAYQWLVLAHGYLPR